jgi:CRISPR system Cascade subunit CasE
MIYLSRLILDPMSRRVQSELSAPYEMHRTLCHAFPGLSKEEWEAARVLFRADEESGRLSLLVQSKITPDWSAFVSRLNGRYLLGAPAVKAWEPHFKVGQSLRFRLQANPVFAPKENGAKNGTRRGLYREAERLDWLRRQSEGHGFELPLLSTTLRAATDENGQPKPIPFRGLHAVDELTVELPVCEVIDLNDGRRFALPSQHANAQKNQFSAARFDGLIRVADPEKFARAVENGIGKARGFGFGLLSVAPATQ